LLESVNTTRANCPCATVLSRFVATMTRCRGSRSATTPPITKNSTAGTVPAADTRPTAVPEPPVSRIANAIATGAADVPSAETIAPAICTL
jgi:hypothetical protein